MPRDPGSHRSRFCCCLAIAYADRRVTIAAKWIRIRLLLKPGVSCTIDKLEYAQRGEPIAVASDDIASAL